MTEEFTRLRSITSTALLVDFAVGRGLAVASVLEGTGIEPADLRDQGAEATLGQELAVMRNIVARIGDEPGLGLLAGLLCHPPRMGVLGFAMMSSPNLRAVLEIGLRYIDLSFTMADLTLRQHGDEVLIVREDRVLPPDLRQFATERDLAAIGTIQQDLVPARLPAVHVELPLDSHPIYETVGTLLGAETLVFNAPRAVIRIPAKALELPLPQADPATTRYYEEQCADLIQRRRNRAGLSGRVRQLLIRRGGLAEQARIAADLDISVRTLRRRLAEEGTTFRELSSETVGLLAEELLVAGLTVENVAERLGYSSVSAFTTAFRAWKGESPGRFGRVHRGHPTVSA
ncbi:AraC family transcriptional regulator ligand-binding domain-containing protein [Nocardia sp. NPDC050406]|uniref:AraC family transcriptional regulator n=1 Tax=Nocardia sp. NPDC050406 TaxID=3364318 RepID=UPI0037B9B605